MTTEVLSAVLEISCKMGLKIKGRSKWFNGQERAQNGRQVYYGYAFCKG